MCDCVPSSTLQGTHLFIIKIPNTRLFTPNPKTPTSLPIFNQRCYSRGIRPTNSGLQFISATLESNGAHVNSPKSTGSEGHTLYGQLEFKQNQETKFEERKLKTSLSNKGIDEEVSLGGDFIGYDDRTVTTELKDEEEDLVVKISGSEEESGGGGGGGGLKIEESEKNLNMMRRGRQLMRRSNLIAKQVISLHSALSLGFVSQLWVDTNSWVVLIVEVRPSLLSGELERFLLDDISQVGDVVLIEDENTMENEFKMVGLETLVRGFTFNINSGAVESLELDSFGLSIIPSSLVSTYALFVKDVLEVASDTVVVHEAAASRIQRLTKGFWDDQKVGNSVDEIEEYSDLEIEPVESDYGRDRKRRSGRQKCHPKMKEIPEEWELPMDFL
ncbi:hypothetical protein LguiA_032004 [Lonicera macranthoides]